MFDDVFEVVMIAALLWTVLCQSAFAQDTGNRGAEEANRQAAEEDVPVEVPLTEAPVAKKTPKWALESYWEPISMLRLEFAKHKAFPDAAATITIQLDGGIAGGVRYFQPDGKLYGFSRASGSMLYSLSHGTFGLDARIGSFFGMDEKKYRITTGPDFFWNTYGGLNGGAADYLIPNGFGMNWDMRGTYKLTRDFWATAWVAPTVTFTAARRTGTIDEMHIGAFLSYFGDFSITVGYRAAWNVAGFQQGPMVAARF